jgi:hypothetical protein
LGVARLARLGRRADFVRREGFRRLAAAFRDALARGAFVRRFGRALVACRRRRVAGRFLADRRGRARFLAAITRLSRAAG